MKRIFPWPKEIFDYLGKLWNEQYMVGNCKRAYGCSGMWSLSLWPERITYDAVNDELLQVQTKETN